MWRRAALPPGGAQPPPPAAVARPAPRLYRRLGWRPLAELNEDTVLYGRVLRSESR